ncbi:MAG: carboxypeptidase-like regulatory domain-containing protein [Lentimicrobium sp.]|nr:carboxypeptidase-like regulatory domain-containing protein [Lentimicrobium sp.]
MKIIFLLILFLISFSNFAQIRGTITDDKGTPLSLVTILEENTYNGTSSNEQGNYELNIKKLGKHTVIFQYLGFKTQKITLIIDTFPFIQNIKLIEESLSLSEVVINTKDNPANAVIRHAIASKKENSEKTAHFKADFYSRGIFKVKDLPKKILGQKIGDLDGAVDSTGTGIIYLSETVSEIVFEKPDNLKEKIIASKVSGDNKGFSYNTAQATIYDFYDNSLDFGSKMISPIANNAFSYYKFKLEGTFQDENNFMINKIKVITKRDAEPVFEGYIYIVEDSWAIYAVDLDIKGYRMHQEFIDKMNLKQNFSYNKNNHIWAKNTQSLDFSAGIFGIKFNGKFSYVYSNYVFEKAFAKKTFTNEIVSFENNSNKKDSLFWNKIRPIPLTIEENTDYIKKDSVHNVRNSKKYLDSIDKKGNKFKFHNPVTGYHWKNSSQKKSFSYDGLLNLSSLSFNTVQGWNLDSGFTFKNWAAEEEKGKSTSISTKFNYGFSDDRLRVTGNYYHRFNNQNYATLTVFGGTKVNQFNPEEPITKFINSVSSLFFVDNYMKLYNKEFAGLSYSQDVNNSLYLKGNLEYQQRKPLFNTTNQAFVKSDNEYSSNNPLLPDDNLTPAFEEHHLTKASVFARINFGNKYISRPDGKINIKNDNYPTLYFGYENAFASNERKYEYQLISGQIKYDFNAGNKGILGINLKAGTFIHGDNISFVDYKHFNGNRTHIGTSERYLDVFNLLPYYSNSTNNAYFEAHLEHNDKGYIMNKIPLLNKLNSTLVLGFHALAVPNTKPYSEFTVGLDNLGFGKFKLFRFDYVHSFQNGVQEDGVVFGLKILNVLE